MTGGYAGKGRRRFLGLPSISLPKSPSLPVIWSKQTKQFEMAAPGAHQISFIPLNLMSLKSIREAVDKNLILDFPVWISSSITQVREVFMDVVYSIADDMEDDSFCKGE